MPAGTQRCFFLEDEDNGTADEYYDPCHKFYYILVGEFTMYWRMSSPPKGTKTNP